ncbi:MAG: HD domain-containing protein [Thermoanaerobaculia bacterium]|nr:HD domain-containing protein [Thermoanaerobaculia bacterium]
MWVADVNQRLEEYRTLLEIGVELAGSLELHRVLELALERAEQICRAETSSIWEVDPQRRELFFRVVRGRAAGEIRHRRLRVGEGIVGNVVLSRQGEIANDVETDPRWRGDLGQEFRTRAILTMPLQAHGEVVGVLQLLNPVDTQGFSTSDLERMRLFAGPLGQAIENARLYSALKRQYLDTVTALAEAIEKRDPYTGGHVRRVVTYSLLLGAQLGLDREELENLRLSATLHDIGKIAVPDQVLLKPAPLDVDEQRIMQRHVVDGAEIVGRIRELRDILPGVRSHHERLDGTGYPDGLAADDVPLLARIIAVADTYDAMTTSRPYRSGLSPETAAEEILGGAGSQFCPQVVAAFASLHDEGRFTVAAGQELLSTLFKVAEER